MNKQLKLTDAEQEILQVLWELGPATVRDVHEVLDKKNEKSYTTTLKQMQIMYEKQLLTRDDSSKSHVYKAAITKKAGQQQAVNKLIRTLFKGSPAQLVMHALGNHQTTKEELDAIRIYLSELEKNTTGK